MDKIDNGLLMFMALISPQDMAKYIVTGFFTIINLLVTYVILKKFLFKPTMRFLNKRKAAVEEEINSAKRIKAKADEKLAEATARIESSIHEATTLVNDSKIQAESQSESIIESAKKEADEILAVADSDIERMRKSMLEDMRDEIAELSISIASEVIKKNIDTKGQKEIINKFIGDEFDKKVSDNVGK